MSQSAVGMPCPICKVPLLMSDRQGVEIDYCPQCRGVWLDRGELDKIVERSRSEPVPSSAPPPVYGWSGGQHHHHKRRRKSFLEELFD